MQKRLQKISGSLCLLLLASTLHSGASCGPAGLSITNLPFLGGDIFNVYALGAGGHVGGYSSVPGEAETHAFLFNAGVTIDFGTLGGTFAAIKAVNASGVAAGYANLMGDSETHAFVTSGTNLHDLGTLGGTFSIANAINAGGQVAGTGNLTGDMTQHAFLYAGSGSLMDLGSLGGDYSTAVGINNSGTVIGDSYDINGFNFGYVFSNGVMTSLGDLGSGFYSSARDINNSGIVVGESLTASAQMHAFLYGGGTMYDLGTLGAPYSTARAVNDAGQVVGVSYNAMFQLHGFIYSGGPMTDLGTLGGMDSSANDINNLGQVVGDARTAGGAVHAFLWQNGVMQDLNSLLPTNSGWVLQSAQFINDAGRVVGYGTLNGSFEWFVLDPSSGNNNSTPVAVATPATQTVDCKTTALLNGSGSSDADGDPLAYRWSEGATVLGTNATLATSFDLGTHTITLRVTDPCGASSETNVVVEVADTTPPVIVGGSAPVTVPVDANCQGAVPNVVAGIVATDNCTASNALVITQDPAAGTLVGSGPHTIIVTVKDASGNTTQGSTSFTVADTVPPVIVGGPAPVTVPVDANCQGAVPDVVSGIVASDNCTPANALVITQDPVAGTLVGSGPHTIIVTVRDAAGNSTQGSTTFNVVDAKAPRILFLQRLLFAETGDRCGALVPDVLADLRASDNCTPAEALVKTQSPAAGTFVGTGAHCIKVTVTDASGNSTTCKVVFWVLDVTPPVVASIQPVLGSIAGHPQWVPVTLKVTASDNCDATPESRIVSVRSIEPASSGDIVITGPLSLNLAPSRKPGKDRCYVVVIRCRDDAGNCTLASVTVNVPKYTSIGQQ